MSYITRTNLCTNPFPATTTGWNWQLGTTEASAYTIGTGAGPDGANGYLRRTITTAKTTGNSGAYRNESISGTAGDTYTSSIWLRSSVAITCSLDLTAKAGASTITQAANSVTLAANTWTRLSTTVSGITGAYDTLQSWVIFNSAQILPAGATFDVARNLVEKIGSAGTYFDGNTPAVNNLAYQWTGTANASSSQEYITQPTVLVTPRTDAPCPRVEVTVAGLSTGTTVFNVWRTADGKRQAVRGGRRRSAVDSDFVVDYEAPLNRVLTYDIEVVSGTQATQPTYPATVTVLSSTWWIQDPLVPSSAIPLNVSKQDSTAPYLMASAVKSLEYGASVTLIPILGSTGPVALMGNRSIAGNVSFDMFTNLATVTTQLRNLLQQTPLLLVRSTGLRNDGIPALAYFAAAKPVEQPVTVAFGGTLTTWKLSGDLVAAPTMNVLVPIWTYVTVAALWATYQQAQTTLAGKTYLDVLKSPTGV